MPGRQQDRPDQGSVAATRLQDHGADDGRASADGGIAEHGRPAEAERRDAAEAQGHPADSVEPEAMAAHSAEVVEPPVLSDPPSSPWSDGFGRTAVRCGQALLLLALAALVVYAAVTLRLVIIPLLIAVLLAAALAPVVTRLTRVGLGRGLATLVTLLAAVLVLGLVGFVVVTAVANQIPALQDSAGQGLRQLEDFARTGPFPVTDAQLTAAREGALNVLRGDAFRSGAIAGAGLVGQFITGLLLAIVVLIYLLKDGPSIFRFFISGTRGNRHTRLLHAGERSASVLGGYVRGTTVVALVDAVIIGAGLLVLGVPLALPLALVVFLTAYIPVIGAVAAGAIAALVTLVTNGPTTALIVVVIVLVVNQIEGNVLAPLVLGKALSLHPLAILLALTAGSIVAGIIGAVLAVPFAAVAWAAVKSWNEDRRSSAELLTAQQPPPPPPDPGSQQAAPLPGAARAG